MTNADDTDLLTFPGPTRQQPITGIPARFSGAVDGKKKYRWQSRIDRAFAKLERRNIWPRHDFGEDAEDGRARIINELENITTFDQPLGYTFYTRQNTTLAQESHKLNLTFGAFDGTAKKSIEVGKKVRAALAQQGLGSWWNETTEGKIMTRTKWNNHGYGEEDSSGAFIDGPKSFGQFIEDTLSREGFTRDRANEHFDDEWKFCGPCSSKLSICSIFESDLQFFVAPSLTLTDDDWMPMRTDISRLNRVANVSSYGETRQYKVSMHARLPVRDFNAALPLFIRLLREDINALYSRS